VSSYHPHKKKGVKRGITGVAVYWHGRRYVTEEKKRSRKGKRAKRKDFILGPGVCP